MSSVYNRHFVIECAVEEIAISGTVSFGKCSRSTLYRYLRDINDYLTYNRFDWRVKADYENNCIYAI